MKPWRLTMELWKSTVELRRIFMMPVSQTRISINVKSRIRICINAKTEYGSASMRKPNTDLHQCDARSVTPGKYTFSTINL
jgi:hypothetical protein